MPVVEWILPGLARSGDLHPMLVHFPVVLIPAAFVLSVLAWRRGGRWWPAARLVTLLAIAALFGAAASGLRAQRFVSHSAGSVVAIHRWFMLTASGLGLVLLFPMFRITTASPRRSFGLVAAGLLLLNAILIPGADRGALVSLELRSGPKPVAATPGTAPDGNGNMSLTAGDPLAGAELYRRLACEGCHGVGRREESPGIPPSLEAVGSRLRPEWMRSYLQHPEPIRWASQDRRPVVRMPTFRLSSGEVDNLVAYLATRQDTVMFSPRGPYAQPYESREVETGRRLFGQYNCHGCHVAGGVGVNLGPRLDDVGARLKAGYVAALLHNPGHVVPGTPMKNEELWDDEIRCLTSYLTALRSVSG
jgi:mono/diheme cytochrome c family protein/uncharacterized membrane protein